MCLDKISYYAVINTLNEFIMYFHVSLPRVLHILEGVINIELCYQTKCTNAKCKMHKKIINNHLPLIF